MMSDEQRTEKIRSAAAQAAALAEARKEMRKWRYGQQERRAPNNKDVSFAHREGEQWRATN